MPTAFPLAMRRVFAAASAIPAIGVAPIAAAQGAAGTDIFLIALSTRDSSVVLGAPLNVTARPGYDNQPAFTPESRALLFTSIRADAQADIYRYELSTRSTSRVTSTTESEYSATVMPGAQRMSVIRVEADSTQRLWSFRLDGTDPRLVLTDIKPVGYHAWATDSLLALFVLGSPATLQFADVRFGTAHVVAPGIGRSLHRIPGTNSISFVEKQSDSVWVIRRLDPATGAVTALIRTRPRVEDHAWAPDGSIYSADGNRLFRWKPFPGSTGAASEWKEVAAFAAPELQRLSRLAISPSGNWLAIVSAEPR